MPKLLAVILEDAVKVTFKICGHTAQMSRDELAAMGEVLAEGQPAEMPVLPHGKCPTCIDSDREQILGRDFPCTD